MGFKLGEGTMVSPDLITTLEQVRYYWAEPAHRPDYSEGGQHPCPTCLMAGATRSGLSLSEFQQQAEDLAPEEIRKVLGLPPLG